MAEIEKKRLFFAFEVIAPWPQGLPNGRLIKEECRHMTIAFLGNVEWKPLLQHLETFPPPPFSVGLTGRFDHPLFLPRSYRPNVAAWNVEFETEVDFLSYVKNIASWLSLINIHIHSSKFLPHVTLCRRPFIINEWKQAFKPLPMYIKDLHLYESRQHLEYVPMWTLPLKHPFEKKEGIFIVRGMSIEQLEANANSACSFYQIETGYKVLREPLIEEDSSLSMEITF